MSSVLVLAALLEAFSSFLSVAVGCDGDRVAQSDELMLELLSRRKEISTELVVDLLIGKERGKRFRKREAVYGGLLATRHSRALSRPIDSEDQSTPTNRSNNR